MIFTTIGSRTTPENICSEMIKIGNWIRDNGHWCRSGHAPGADIAFEHGATWACDVYLPWWGFNFEQALLTGEPKLMFENGIPLTVQTIARKIRPSFNGYSSGVQKLLARNVYQVLGSKLDKPSDLVIAYYDPSKSGGTEFTVTLAKSCNIPVVNMFDSTFNTAEKVISHIKENFKCD